LAAKRKNRYLLCALSWTILITLLSLSPVSETPGVELPWLDKVVHFFFYLLFAILWYLYLNAKRLKNAAIKIFLFSVTYGIIIEVLQHSTPFHRHFDVGDIIANTLGTVMGIVSAEFYFYKQKTLKRKK
jgi:VanZ family protein